MSQPKIEKLDELIKKCVGENKKVSESEVTRLTQPGENFGSIMLRVDAKLTDDAGREETWHAVAKCLPDDEFLREVFRIDVSVKAETAFYMEIVPLLEEFLKEQGVDGVLDIDFFPKFFGGRFNLNEEGDVIDDHAVLILENLIVKGFRNIDRHLGFDYEDAKLVLKDLAVFHAVPLALRLQKPQVFKEKIKKYCYEKVKHPAPEIGLTFTDIVADVEECKPYLEKLDALEKNFMIHLGSKPPREEIFTTIVHSDMWVNNTMQRFEDGKAVENKFIDFQGYIDGSPVTDLMFFLWTSCQFTTLKHHLEDLIKHYYQHFVQTLKILNCDTTTYTFDKFTEERKTFVHQEILQSMFFTTFIVFGKKANSRGQPNFNIKKEDVSLEVKNRLALMISYYGKLGWL